MLAAYILSLREGLEAALIVGILIGALRQMRRQEMNRYIWAGLLSAAAVALLGAGVLHLIGFELEGHAEEIFEGATMLLAAGVLTWVIFWMRGHAAIVRRRLEHEVQQALRIGAWGLFGVAFVAVIREGLELALFLTATTLTSGLSATLWGALLGLGTAVLLGWSLFASLLTLDLRRFFQVTTVLLLLFAAGLVAHGIHAFNEVGWIPAVIKPLWDINPILSEQSVLGQILTALFGYNGNPSLTEVVGYLAYLAAVTLALRRPPKMVPQTTA